MKYAMVFAATAAFTSVSATGTFAVVNRCGHDLYLWSVMGNQPASQMFTLPANSPHIGYSEPYRYAGQYEGVSIKVAPYYVGNGQVPPPSLNITQLEYTVPPPENNDPSIYYDLSMVNGNAVMGIPFTYSPSQPGAVPQCKAGSCSGDYATCQDGYNGAHDDWNTHACPKEQDIIFTFCDGNAEKPLLVPTGQVTVDQFSGLSCIDGASCLRKREAEPEAQPETDADPLAVCYSAAAANAGEGVPILAALCENAATSSSSAAPVPTTTSTPPPASTPSAVAALQQPAAPVAPAAPPKASTTSSSSVAPVATQAAAPAPAPVAPAPVPAAPAAPATAPLSQLQLSSLANTGVTCWQSVSNGQTCGVSARSLPEKRSVHALGHSHRHSHQAFHRRNRIIKSAS